MRTYAAEYRHWPAAIKAAKELLWSNSRDPPRRSTQSSIQTFVEMATKKSEDKSRDTQRLILETVLGDYKLLTGKKWNVAPNVRNLLEALGPLGQVLNDVMTPESDMENGNPTPAAIFFEQGCLDACVNQTLEYGLQLKRETARVPPATIDCTAISICIHLMMHLVAAIALVQAPLGVSQADIHRVSLVGQVGRMVGAPTPLVDWASRRMHEILTALLLLFSQAERDPLDQRGHQAARH